MKLFFLLSILLISTTCFFSCTPQPDSGTTSDTTSGVSSVETSSVSDSSSSDIMSSTPINSIYDEYNGSFTFEVVEDKAVFTDIDDNTQIIFPEYSSFLFNFRDTYKSPLAIDAPPVGQQMLTVYYPYKDQPLDRNSIIFENHMLYDWCRKSFMSLEGAETQILSQDEISTIYVKTYRIEGGVEIAATRSGTSTIMFVSFSLEAYSEAYELIDSVIKSLSRI